MCTKWMNCMVCELYPNTAVYKEEVEKVSFYAIIHSISPESFQHFSTNPQCAGKSNQQNLTSRLAYPVSPPPSHSLLLPIFKAFKIRFLSVLV